MLKTTYDLIIIGGGPVGLNAAIKASKYDYNFLLLESQSQLGGQLIELYPEKEIIDISGLTSILAKDYIEWLLAQLPATNKQKLLTNKKVTKIKPVDQIIEVETSGEVYQTRTVIVATGLGVYMPRLLECRGVEGCHNIIYALHRLDFLRDKRVVIMGGGDAALDWARDISKVTPFVTLVHRRHEFRGDVAVINKLKNLTVKKPFLPIQIFKDGANAQSITIQNVETLALEKLTCDYIFVNYGHIPISASFGLEKIGPGLAVNSVMQTSQQHVYAVGDVVNYQNKKRRIDAGIYETELVFAQLESVLSTR